METTIKPLTDAQVAHVVKIAIQHYEWSPEYTPQVSMTDEFGWADEKSPIIMWEEGPYNFGYEFTQNEEAKSYLRALGFYMEAATSWAVAIYPIDGVAGSWDSPATVVGWCGNTRHPSETHEERLTCIGFIADNEEV